MSLRPVLKIWFFVSALGYLPVFAGLVAWGYFTDPWIASDGCIIQQSKETISDIVLSNLFLWLCWAAINLVASIVGIWGLSRLTGNAVSLTDPSSGTR
jgi:hypothetical protein